MINIRCPGQDRIGLKVRMRECPHCGYRVEIFSDEIKAECPGCKTPVYQGKLPSCVDWCKMAKQCTGESRYREPKGTQDKE